MVYEELNSLLTENEKKIYIELLRLGESTASPILEKTGLQNSVFYRTIHRLMDKGFVTYILRGKIKHFRASNPEMFLAQEKRRELEIKELIPKLKEIQKVSQNKTTAEVFIGLKGLVSMYYELISDSKPGEEYYFFGFPERVLDDAMNKVYIPFRKYRIEKKLKVYGLLNTALKGKIKQFSHVKEKYVDYPLPPNMAIFRDKIVIVSWGDIPTGILIQSQDVADQYKTFFNLLWKNAK